MATITILDDARATEADAALDSTGAGTRVLVAAGDFETATGWALKPEGLCRGAVCVPVRSRPDAVVDGRVDVEAVAPLLGLTALVDAARGVVAYAPAAAVVGDALAHRQASDFTLPQLDGTPFTFSAIGRKKKLIVAWASW